MVIEDVDNIINDLLLGLGHEIGRREYRFRQSSLLVLVA